MRTTGYGPRNSKSATFADLVRPLAVIPYACACIVCRQPLYAGDCVRLTLICGAGSPSWKPAHIHDCAAYSTEHEEKDLLT